MSQQNIESIRRELAKSKPTTAGDEGEKFARNWMTCNNWRFECVDQSKNNISSDLRALNGKRPDFILEPLANGDIIFIDAKYHSTKNEKFALKEYELLQYDSLIKYVKTIAGHVNVDLLFMLFPKENSGKRLIFVSLDEMLCAKSVSRDWGGAREFDLSQRIAEKKLCFDI